MSASNSHADYPAGLWNSDRVGEFDATPTEVDEIVALAGEAQFDEGEASVGSRLAPLDVRRCLKQVGRGGGVARSLSRSDMQILFGAVLDGTIADLELGGLLMALRMKGESLDEIVGALAALQARLAPVPIDPQRSVISIPSYNGARRSAGLTALLAALLADAGMQVIIHGVRRDPSRVTTCEIVQAMGHSPAGSVAEAGYSLERGNPVFVPIEVLCPAFARLLKLRERLGVRHIGHTLARLLAPIDSVRYGVEHCARLMSSSHPEFDRLQHALMEALGARAVVMRAGGPGSSAGARRMVQMDWIEDGSTRLLAAGELRPIARPMPLPPAQDAVATAAYIQSALSGEQPVPEVVARQVALILAVVRGPPAGDVGRPAPGEVEDAAEDPAEDPAGDPPAGAVSRSLRPSL